MMRTRTIFAGGILALLVFCMTACSSDDEKWSQWDLEGYYSGKILTRGGDGVHIVITEVPQGESSKVFVEGMAIVVPDDSMPGGDTGTQIEFRILKYQEYTPAQDTYHPAILYKCIIRLKGNS